MKQLELDLWWHDSDIWKVRHLVSHTARPVEDEALKNIYSDSKIAHSVNIAPSLSGLERRIYTLELRSMRELPRWYTAVNRREWIAKQARISVYEIESILDNVSYVLRGFESYERVQTNKAWRNAAKEVFSEIANEYAHQKRTSA